MTKVIEQFLSNDSVILLREAERDVLYETSFWEGEEISRDWFSFSEEVQSILYFLKDSRFVFRDGLLIDSRTTTNEFKHRGNFELD